MIPSTTNKLLVAEDWTKVYQSFKNAEFKSYDFETLRRTMITYLRENYPEDFNDYIDSSEYIALIDLIAFLGQNLSFRIDLNARENFLETAERRDSILRLARLINYNAKRNIPAHGFLKITSVSTTENVSDANGINLSNSIVGWNDPSNPNWYQQFISIMNAAMASPTAFGKPFSAATIDGISTEQYKINTSSSDVPIYSFSKSIAGTQMSFELVPATFDNQEFIYEDTPRPGNQFGIVFKNDNKGSASANTGFFVHFRQGSLTAQNFSVTNPVPNELVGVNVTNINDSDVWLWQMSEDNAVHQTLWTKVSATTGNNIIYNSLNLKERNIYSVLTRDNDQIDLSFADGSFGNLPNGPFRLYYRQSNGLSYTIKPEQLSNISVQIPYTSRNGQSNALTIVLSLQYTVTNSAGSESNADIKLKAPQAYYTQNRMITAEDYNIAPLTVDSDILKVKSVNRIASGISKYYELSDVSGKYSSTDIFADDGILYKEDTERNFEFTFISRNDLVSVVKSQIAPIIDSAGVYSFYLSKYPQLSVVEQLIWNQSNKTTNQTRGYFNNNGVPATLGDFASDVLTFITPGALIKVVPPTNKYFSSSGKIVDTQSDTTKDYIWTQVVNVIGDGTSSGMGNLPDGTGPVVLTGVIPGNGLIDNSATVTTVIPKFQSALTYSLESEIVNLCLSKRNFGLSFDSVTRQWYVVTDANIDLKSPFSLTFQKDTSNVNKDSSWIVAFVWTGKKYVVRHRSTDYIFESEKKTAFFVDNSKKNYDFVTDTVIKDKIDVLSINKNPTSADPLATDYSWQIDSAIIYEDGYVEPKKVLVSFFDHNDDGQIDDPDSFDKIVSPLSTSTQTGGYLDKFVYFQTSANGQNTSLYTGDDIYAYPNEDSVLSPEDDRLYYFYDPSINVVKRYTLDQFVLEPTIYARSGRKKLKFHYVHNSAEDRRLDPSKLNIVDVYLLTKAYDLEYRNWLSSGTGVEPLPPTTQSLESNYSPILEPIKAISDEIIYHPVNYKVLFGNQAAEPLQATFKAVINPARSVSTTDLQTRILTAIEDFFAIENWDFGQTFNFSELSTYVMNIMSPDITNFVIVPKMDTGFGSLYQITCASNEIFINGASVNDIQIIDGITSTELKASTTIVTSS